MKTVMKPSSSMLVLAPLVGTLIAFAAAIVVTRSAEARGGEGAYWDDEEVAFVRRMVANSYVDELGDKKQQDLFYGALDAYVKGLPDEYNDFYPPDEYRRWRDDTAGHYAGVGVRVEAEARGIRLVGVYPGGPAAKAGLAIGDVVTSVEGRSLAGADARRDATVRILKGTPGSAVHVRVWSPAVRPAAAPESRPAPAPEGTPAPEGSSPPAAGAEAGTERDVTMVRDVIRPATVFPRRVGKDGRTAYIRIAEFTEQTADDFDRALDDALAGGARAVVVDLRGNGGGVLPSTVRAADRFVRDGVIVRMEGRAYNATRVEAAHANDTIPDDVGLVVLVDGHTASASEVFAGCIQDHRRGVVLGSRTYGKFLVQNITEIPGKGAALKLTTARYQTPLGRSYQRPPKDPTGAPAGLIPDIALELAAADREKLDQQLADVEDAVWGVPAKHPEVGPGWVDPQLQKALDLIDGNLLLEKIRSSGRGNG
jgi:carboxyl-terminal processing protease